MPLRRRSMQQFKSTGFTQKFWLQKIFCCCSSKFWNTVIYGQFITNLNHCIKISLAFEGNRCSVSIMTLLSIRKLSTLIHIIYLLAVQYKTLDKTLHQILDNDISFTCTWYVPLTFCFRTCTAASHKKFCNYLKSVHKLDHFQYQCSQNF